MNYELASLFDDFVKLRFGVSSAVTGVVTNWLPSSFFDIAESKDYVTLNSVIRFKGGESCLVNYKDLWLSFEFRLRDSKLPKLLMLLQWLPTLASYYYKSILSRR